MKKLIVIRHGQSENLYSSPDFERKLNSYGVLEVRKTALLLKQKGLTPDKIISSSAIRTKMTTENICDVLGIDINNVVFDKYIYNFFSSTEFIKDIICKIDNSLHTVFIIGHNPTITTTVQMLTGEYGVGFDTANAAVISFDVDSWQLITAKSGNMIDFIVPV